MEDIVYMAKATWENILKKIREKKGEELPPMTALELPGVIDNLPNDNLLRSMRDEIEECEYNEVEEIQLYFFYNRKKLKKASFPNCGLVNNNAFSGCTALEEIILKDGVKVNNYAFMNCPKIPLATLLKKISSMANYAFAMNGMIIADGFNYPEDIEINENITSISDYAFNCNSKIRSATLPCVTEIGNYAFGQDYNSYRSYSQLETIIMPVCKKIGSQSFKYQKKLKNIDLTNVETILSEAFSYCESLEIIDTIATIGNKTFSYCTGIKELKYRGTKIGESNYSGNSFISCTSLNHVWISANCQYLYANNVSYAPFKDCTALTDIYVETEEKPDGWGTYWNYTASGVQATVHWGVSEADFDAIVAAEEAAEQGE